MNTELNNAAEILKHKFPNAEHNDWFKPVIECMEKYAEQWQFEQKDLIKELFVDKLISELKQKDEQINRFKEALIQICWADGMLQMAEIASEILQKHNAVTKQ